MVNGVGTLWKAAGDFILLILETLPNVTGSWGIAIILLTLAVRILLHPLTHKQMVSMQRMQKLQPRMKMLQEKYKDDKETLNREIMSLYKENKVNPAAGCLPLLVQLPILILLFRLLMNYNFGSVPFLGFISLEGSVLSTLAQAVALPETTKIGVMAVLSGVLANPAGLAQVGLYLGNLMLLVVVGILTWAQQQMSSTGNPQMAMMSWFMPLFLTFICLSLPGGVLLYWGVSSFLGVAQQWWITKKTSQEMQEKPVLHKSKPAGKEEN
jgi:YidC/Oxa1 family membrane protein insertase